jgi:hypothetical protein
MSLLEAVQLAISHLGLACRPCRVDEYGIGHFRVRVDCGILFPVVVIQDQKVVKVVGEKPEPDTISREESMTQALAFFPTLEEAFRKKDMPEAVHAIESLISTLHPAVAARALARISKWEMDDYSSCCFRRSDAARRGFERASGKQTPIVSVEERLINRDRSAKRVAERDAMIEVIAREIGSKCLFELITAMAGFRIGVKKAASKLSRAIEASKILVRRCGPYLTDNPIDHSPNAIYSKHANDDIETPRKEDYRQLKKDHEQWKAVCEREIAAAEKLLGSTLTATT